jgi:hypothetical protein
MPSSVIATMSYNDEARTLTIVYRGNRGVYRYFDVPPEEFAAFRAAPSKGIYLNEIIKAIPVRTRRRPPNTGHQPAHSSTQHFGETAWQRQ